MRRHHCRICGSLVCGACSPHRVVLETGSRVGLNDKEASGRPERVCKTCKQREVEHGSFAAAYAVSKHRSLAAPNRAQDTMPVFAGYLEKKGSAQGTFGRRNWKRRWFTLTADHKLSYYETTQHSSPLGALDLSSQTLVVSSDRRGFTLRSATRDFQMRTEVGDNTHYQQWITHLSRAVAIAKGEELPAVDDDSEEEEDRTGAAQTVHRVFRDDEPIGIVLVELDADSGGFLVAVESLLDGGQAERQEQEHQREHQQSGAGTQPQCVRPGLVLVGVNEHDVQGWRYSEVVPVLATRPLSLSFREDASCEKMLKTLAPLANTANVAGEVSTPRDSGHCSESALTTDTGSTETTSLWHSSLAGAAVGTMVDGDDAPLVLVLLARMLRQNDCEFFLALELFAREPNRTLFSELRHYLCTVATEDELQQAIDSDGNEMVAKATSDPYVLSALYLQFLREWPGGLLRGIDREALLECDSEDHALDLLGGLGEPEQDILNATIALLVEVSEQEETNQMGHAELAMALAAALTTCSTTDLDGSDSGPTSTVGLADAATADTGLVLRLDLDSEAVEVFVYILIDFWAENIR